MRSSTSSSARGVLAAIALLLGTAILASCSTESPPISGPPDDLWQKARVEKPGKPWVVGVGDSFMSGEGGRWASNGDSNATVPGNGGWLVGTVDQVYGDSPEGTETIPYCHRTATAPMFTGADVNHKNLACSGAQTNSFVNTYGRAKPGIDFLTITSSNGQKVQGQATQLRDFAKNNDVNVVALSIGGNDLGFAKIISTCLQDWIIGSPCSKSDYVASLVNPSVKAIITKRVRNAIDNVNAAMRQAGYKPSEWRMLVQLPPAPVPPSDKIGYDDLAFDRQVLGGCGLLNPDLDWADKTLLPFLDGIISDAVVSARKEPTSAPMTVVDMRYALDGHRLCATGTSRPPAGTGLPPDGFSQNVEWVRFISVYAAEMDPESADAQEAMHPSYFGQRALASCMTLAAETQRSTQRTACSPAERLVFGPDALPQMNLETVADSQ